MLDTRRPTTPELDANGNCTACGEHPTLHIHHGVVLPLPEFHRRDIPGHLYADEVAC